MSGPASKGAIPKTTSFSKQAGSSKAADKTQKGKGKPSAGGKGKKDDKKEVVEWQLPAFGIPPQRNKQEINWERLRKDTARRQSPEGEDLKEIRRILKEVKGMDVPVHEFINMIAQYTSDNGTAMRSVMAEDLESFRKLAKKVYETMTQDVSDVLVNEQLQMVQYYEEKNGQLSDKMMRAINEIYEMAPNFDFEKFLKDKQDYVQTLFPLPHEAERMMSDDTADMVRRQQAYHRLQWLKSEGERMSEENKRLMRRLEELKKEQQYEQNRAAERAAEAETKRQELSKEENDMKDKLEKLNESVEKSFIREEMNITKEHNRTAMEVEESEESLAGASHGAVRKTRSGVKKPRPKKPQWSSSTAVDLEEAAAREAAATDAAARPPSASRSSVKRSKATRQAQLSPVRTPQAAAEEEDIFISFGKAKPKRQAKPPSPFHYSPPKSPPQETRSTARDFAEQGAARPVTAPRQASPFHYSPPRSPPVARMQETKIEEATTTIQQKRPQPRIRTTRAPKDTWGGFF